MPRALVFCGACAIAAGAFLWARAVTLPLLRGPHGYVLADPDSFVRWRLVERAIHGEGLRIRWMTEDNAPWGRTNEWTVPMTFIGVTVVRAGETLCGWSTEEALQRGKMVVGPLLGLLVIVALAGLGWKASPSSKLTGILWVLAFPFVGSIVRNGFGNTDHHSLHELLFVCMVAGCVAWAGNPTTAGGVFVGVASAVGLWSGGEMLPAVVLVATLAVAESTPPPRERVLFWRGWWISGLVVTGAALLFEFWPHPFHALLEFLSIWYVMLWIICGGLLEYLWRVDRPAARRFAVFAAILLALATAGAVRHFDWAHLHVYQDPRFQSQSAMEVESQSFGQFGLGRSLVKAAGEYGALPLLLVAAIPVWRLMAGRERWVVVVAGVYLMFMLSRQRWSDFFAVSLVMAGGLIVQRLWPGRTALCAGVVVVATMIPAWRVVRLEQEIKLAGPQAALEGPCATTLALGAVSDCLGTVAPGAVVLAPWDQGSVLAGMGQVRVVGSGYWTNRDGLMDTDALFATTDDAEFWTIVRARQIEFVLVREPETLAADIALAIVARHGIAPSRERIEGTVLWKLINSRTLSSVACPELARLQPGWRIFKVSPVAIS